MELEELKEKIWERYQAANNFYRELHHRDADLQYCFERAKKEVEYFEEHINEIKKED